MKFMHAYTKKTFETCYGAGFWTSSTILDAIHAHAARDPQRVAIVDANHRIDYAALCRATDGLAARLRREGIGAGDVVAVQLPNSAHLAVLILALLRLGAVYLAVNPAYREHDLSRIFQVARPKLHVFPTRFKNTDYAAISAQVGGTLEKAPAPFGIDIDGQLSAILDDPSGIEFAPADADALFLLCSTSGSTGTPKLYAHTQNTQFNEGKTLNALFHVTASDNFLVCFPLTHRGALMFGLLQAMAAGSKLVVLREFDADAIVSAIESEQVSAFFAIPTQVYEVMEAARRQGAACSHMRLLMLAGAPVHPDLCALIEQRWKGCFPITGYGASEGGFSTCTRLDDPREKLQTCGRTIPGQEVRIDKDDRSASAEGEVLVKGAFLFGGYFADQHQTNASFKGDWFRTGDLGRMDADGTLHITGRLKNMIIRGGLKIQAEEVESIVLQHPDVSEALAIGLPDARLGERVAICVVPRPGRAFSGAALVAHLKTCGVTKFKWPEYIAVRGSLPRNAVGKQDRVAFRKHAAQIDFEKVGGEA